MNATVKFTGPVADAGREQHRSASADVPLTPRQALMWIETQLHPDVPLNDMVTRVALPRDVDVQALQRAFTSVVARHDALRMVIAQDGDELVARFREAGAVELTLVDVCAGEDPERDYRAWVQSTGARVFAPDEPLCIAALVERAGERRELFIIEHHAITDGRSSQALLRDLDARYRSIVDGDSSASDAPPSAAGSYREHLLRRAGHLGGAAAAASERYWSQRFADPPQPMSFYGRSTDIKSAMTDRVARYLSSELCEKMLALREQVRPSLVFTTALFAFLRRATGNEDICIGVPLLNREPEFDWTLGLFMEVSLNRLTVTETDTFASLLEKVRAEVADTKPHRGHTVTHRNARFEAQLNYRPPAEIELCGERVTPERAPYITMLDSSGPSSRPGPEWAARNALDVDITYTPADGRFLLAMDFNVGVWPERRARERAFAHFERLLRQLLDDPEQVIDAVDILTDDERRAVLAQWSAGPASPVPETGVHEWFEQRVAEDPDAIAVEHRDEHVTYGELDRRVNRLSHHLLAKGMPPETLVGVYLERSIEMVVALLAVLKAGSAWVPLDPGHPRKRLEMIAQDTGVRTLITSAELAARLPEFEAIHVDDARHCPTHSPAQPYDPSRLAYVISTSGSTGRPKGVMIEGRSFAHFVHAGRELLQLDHASRVLSSTTISFDPSLLELFVPLACGARIIVVDRATSLDGPALAEVIDACGATHLQATPSAWNLLLNAGWKPRPGFVGLTGGEFLGQDLAEHLPRNDARLWNLYGPTESTVWATALAVHADGFRSGDVGRPMANYRVHILDRWDRVCPIGVVGELAVGGRGVARGYYGRPDLTAERFREVPGLGRLYFSGDLARWRDDGHIELLGRADFQIKLRGHRIEPGEVEAALRSHPAVREAAVTTFGDGEGKCLAAFIVPAGADSPDLVGAVREHLRELLPGYMIPGAWTTLDRLPMTATGKIDRLALPAPDTMRADAVARQVAPRTPLQEHLAAIWAEVLGIPSVGIRDDFFDLGGHSLQAVRVVARMEPHLGRKLALSEFFESRTIESLAGTSCDELPVGVSVVRGSGSLEPFFAVGSHPRYVEVARQVDHRQPFYRLDVYALQARRKSQGSAPHASVEAIAEHFVDAIQSLQARGPYHLGGGCEGALTAFAVASELQRRGEEVARLVLWITPAPGFQRGTVFGKSAVVRLLSHLRILAGRARASDLRLRTLRELIRHYALDYAIFRAMDRYEPEQPFRGDICLVRTAEHRFGPNPDRALGWDALATGRVRVWDTPGNHDTWLNQHAGEFGALLERVLRISVEPS